MASRATIRICLKRFLKARRKKGGVQPALYTFKEGMEMLPKSLIAQLDCPIHYHKEIKEWDEIEGDWIISTLPMHALAPLLKCVNPLNYVTLSLVHLGWEGRALKKTGYGFLIPSSEGENILGMTWDSEIFPELNRGSQTRLTVMIAGSFPEQELRKRALEAIHKWVHIDRAPDVVHITEATRAIPQYPPFYFQIIEGIKKMLPPHVLALGTPFESVAINDLIINAKKHAADFSA